MGRSTDTRCYVHLTVALLAVSSLVTKILFADEWVDTWDQCDFFPVIEGTDCHCRMNVDENGNPVSGSLVSGFNPYLYPDGYWLWPGYYRLIIETSVSHPPGPGYSAKDEIDTVALSNDAGLLDWIKPKPSNSEYPWMRMYLRGSFPSNGYYYQTGTFFVGTIQRLSIHVISHGNDALRICRVWLFRNVDPDPGSLRVLSWNVHEGNCEMEQVGEILQQHLNRPDLAAFQELSYDKRHICGPETFGKENCIMGIMAGYAGASGMNLGDSGFPENYGFSDGDLFDVYGIGNFFPAIGRTDHYQGIITKKSVWPDVTEDGSSPYDFTTKGVGMDGVKFHHYGLGTYNCCDNEGCWHCPWPAKNIDHENCCGIDAESCTIYGNTERCRNNYYFTNDHQLFYKNDNGRHLTARFMDRSGKEGVMVTTHLKAKDGRTKRKIRKKQMKDIISHVTDPDAMYGPEYFWKYPLVIVGDMNLRHDEQYDMLKVMRGALEDAGVEGGVVDLAMAHGFTDADTHPGKGNGISCDDTGDRDPFDKIYLVGGAAAMDNDVEYKIGDNIGLCNTCCSSFCENIYSTCTDHYPVLATLATRTLDSIESYTYGPDVGGFSAAYSGGHGEAPAFDFKFLWEEEVGDGGYRLLGESRNGWLPFYVHENVKMVPDGVEGTAALFEGDGYVMFHHHEELSSGRRLTIEVWVKPEHFSLGLPYTIVIKGGIEERFNYLLDIIPSTADYGWLRLSLMDNDCSDVISSRGLFNNPPIVAGRWHHVLVSFDGLHVKMIVAHVVEDGYVSILNGGESYLGPNVDLCEKSDPLWVGARFEDGIMQKFFHGEMDDLQIYTSSAR